MLVSVVIPAQNAENTLAQCLEACLAQTHRNLEIIVVDDGSTDATARIAQAYPVNYVHRKNRGPAAARNHGARVAAGEIIAFTDSDCIPEPQWIERLLEGFSTGAAGVGGTYGIANPDSVLARIVHEEIAVRHARLQERVDFLGSFNVAYRRSAFEAAGGFDEDFTMASGEDNDLAYRVANTGGALRFVKEARVNHMHPTRLAPYLRKQMWHGFWRVKLYTKHPGRARRGDAYAGPGQLVAPIWALLIALTLPIALTSPFFCPRRCAAGLLAGWAVFSLAYLAIHGPTALRMARRTGDKRMLMFSDLAFVRDLARALGMIRGIWTFLIRRKARP